MALSVATLAEYVLGQYSIKRGNKDTRSRQHLVPAPAAFSDTDNLHKRLLRHIMYSSTLT